jgi:hypothetical protein
MPYNFSDSARSRTRPHQGPSDNPRFAGRGAPSDQRDVDASARTAATATGAHPRVAGGAPKEALTGMAWQGYYLDTEGNTFGLHQPDPQAK